MWCWGSCRSYKEVSEVGHTSAVFCRGFGFVKWRVLEELKTPQGSRRFLESSGLEDVIVGFEGFWTWGVDIWGFRGFQHSGVRFSRFSGEGSTVFRPGCWENHLRVVLWCCCATDTIHRRILFNMMLEVFVTLFKVQWTTWCHVPLPCDRWNCSNCPKGCAKTVQMLRIRQRSGGNCHTNDKLEWWT